MYVYMYMYFINIYIYIIYTHTYTYIYIYICGFVYIYAPVTSIIYPGFAMSLEDFPRTSVSCLGCWWNRTERGSDFGPFGRGLVAVYVLMAGGLSCGC